MIFFYAAAPCASATDLDPIILQRNQSFSEESNHLENNLIIYDFVAMNCLDNISRRNSKLSI